MLLLILFLMPVSLLAKAKFNGDISGSAKNLKIVKVGQHPAAHVCQAVSDYLGSSCHNHSGSIVRRNCDGSFAANIISANLVGDVEGNVTGNADTATNAISANSAVDFTGELVGDVAGLQHNTVVNFVGGQSADAVATGAQLANNAASLNLANSLVRRDDFGGFAAGTVTANLVGNVTGDVVGSLRGNATSATSAVSASTATSFTGSIIGDVRGGQKTTQVNFVGGQTASSVAGATRLANGATNINTPGALVRRDGNGSFVAGNITTTGLLGAAGSLSFSTAGAERMLITSSAVNIGAKLVTTSLICNQAMQFATPTNNGFVDVNQSTSILVLSNHHADISNFTVNFPPSATNGQLFTILLASIHAVNLNNVFLGSGAVVNGITNLNTSVTTVKYIYLQSSNSWYCQK